MKFFILVILSLASSLSASVSSYPIENINFPDDMPPKLVAWPLIKMVTFMPVYAGEMLWLQNPVIIQT